MPKIALGPLNLDVDAELTSGIAKYFRGALSLGSTQQAADSLRKIADVTLQDVPLQSVSLGLSVERPVDVGSSAVEWTVEAGAAAHLGFFKPGEDAISESAFGEGSALPVPEGKAYVAFGIEARLGAGMGLGAGDLSFGFSGGTTLTASSYRCFDATAKVREALPQALANFQIPGDWEDLTGLPAGAAVSVGGAGRLAFSVKGAFASSVNPLAVTIPGTPVDVKLTAGASITAGVDAAVSTEYEIRVIRHEDTLLLGFYRSKDAEATVSVGAKAGVAVTAGGFDLAANLIAAIGGSAGTDAEFLQKAGLSVVQIERIAATVKDAVNRKLEASLDAAFRRVKSGEAAFLFRVDLNSAAEAARSAIRRALDGDLRPLTSGESIPGIRLLRTIATETWKKSIKFRVNLLGIYNYGSLTELVKQDRVMFEPVSGDIVITDSATATRIAASALNTEADLHKLRKVLYDSFMVTATFCGSRLLGEPPAITAKHSYFELHGKTNRQIVKDYIDVPLAMGLPVSKEERSGLMEAGMRHGRSALYAEAGYGAASMRGLFFDPSGSLRSYDSYTQHGREALTLLVQEGDEGDFRRLIGNATVWKALEKGGSAPAADAALQELIPGLPPTSRAAVYSDYLTISFWAECLVDLGKTIAEIDRFFEDHPGGVDRDDKRLNKFRDSLRKRLADMAAKSKEKWGDPWGLVAVDLASGRKAAASVRITTDEAVYEAERESAAAAGE